MIIFILNWLNIGSSLFSFVLRFLNRSDFLGYFWQAEKQPLRPWRPNVDHTFLSKHKIYFKMQRFICWDLIFFFKFNYIHVHKIRSAKDKSDAAKAFLLGRNSILYTFFRAVPERTERLIRSLFCFLTVELIGQNVHALQIQGVVTLLSWTSAWVIHK